MGFLQEFLLAVLACGSTAAAAQWAEETLRMPSFLSDNMVLQRGSAALWGWAPAASTVKIQVAITASTTAPPKTIVTATATAAADGRWVADIVGTAALNRSVITVTDGASSLVLQNVAFGDVFLCGGQSNMEYPMADVLNGDAERAASSIANLRMLNFQDKPNSTAQDDCPSKAPYVWAESAPSTITPRSKASDPDKGGFANKYPSAVCWFAARDLLRANPTVPIGIISAAKSGSAIELWMPPAAIVDGIPRSVGGNGTCGGTAVQGATPSPPATPTPPPPAPQPCPRGGISKSGGYYYGMIAPLTEMKLSGVWWYQGEENDHPDDACPGPVYYKCMFPAMIQYWREQFKQPALPFYYVLLAGGHSAVMREAQAEGGGALPHTAFASAIDLSAALDEYLVAGHPPRKQELGRRVSLLARRLIYSETAVDYQGPQVTAAEVAVSSAAATVRLTFTVGSNGNLHVNGTGGCSVCCNATANAAAATFVGLVDPDLTVPPNKTAVVTKVPLQQVGGNQVVAVVAGWTSSKGRAEVQFLFDNGPQCALYSGALSGPDSYYAAAPHYGLVAQSWRGVVAVAASPMVL